MQPLASRNTRYMTVEMQGRGGGGFHAEPRPREERGRARTSERGRERRQRAREKQVQKGTRRQTRGPTVLTGFSVASATCPALSGAARAL